MTPSAFPWSNLTFKRRPNEEQAMQAAEEFASTRDGVRLAFRRRGRRHAPRAVLIHSLALDGSIWDGVVAELDSAADVLTYDCRGHGASERRAGKFTVELFADDLADLLDHTGWPDAVVVGCSMGGCVAQAFAHRYPDRVKGLALIDTTAWYGPGAPAEWRKRAAAALSEGLAGLADFQATRWFSDAFREAEPDVVQRTLQVFLDNVPECYAASCIMLGEADLRPYLPRFKMPVAVIVGEEDYATPVAAAEALRRAIPDASLTVLPNSRHLTPIESPKSVAREVRSLLERVQAAPSR
jgi:3-oxoadipate enol-lactonase